MKRRTQTGAETRPNSSSGSSSISTGRAWGGHAGTANLQFVSCDWGTTNFRLRLIGGPAAAAEVCTDEGAAKLAAAGGDRAAAFHDTLNRGLERLGAPADFPVVISGMASSSIGWCELPYARLPFALDGRDIVSRRLDGRIHLLSGVRCDDDMMRGEETQAAGLAAWLGGDLPDEATFLLPGTHSKHLTIRHGSITGLRTFMTGELFDLLAGQSVLRHSTDPAGPFDRDGFIEGVATARRDRLTAALFQVRTRQVLAQRSAAANTGFLSGLLIGSELAGLATGDRPVILAAGPQLAAAYALAAEGLGFRERLSIVEAGPLAASGQAVVLRRLLAPEAQSGELPAR